MEFMGLAKGRYSCRKLEGEVSDAQIAAILESARVAPTAKNLQPFRVWVMRSPEAVEKIGKVTSCTFGAKVFFLVGAKRDEAWVRPFDGANFADVDASIVATHMMLEIQALGLATTWVGFFDAPKLQELCPETAGYDLVAIFPVGHPAPGAAPAPRHTEYKPDGELFAEI